METNFTIQLSALIPKAKRGNANIYLDALGFGPDNFSVEVANASGTIVMFGMGMPDDGSMQTALEAVQPAPDGYTWADYGLTQAKVNAAVSAINVSAGTVGIIKGNDHFDDYATANGVARTLSNA